MESKIKKNKVFDQTFSQKVWVGASILGADFSALGEEIKRIEKSGIDIISVDVMDGHFVNNITMGPVIVKAVRKMTKLPIEVHLMIENPENHIDAFAKAGADIFNVHIEACKNVDEMIKLTKKYGKTGLAIKPSTPASVVDKYLNKIDMVLVMTVDPGFAGQEFIDMTSKIRYLKNFRKEFNFDIWVDGGINDKTAKIVRDAGANVLISASYIFNHNNPEEAIRKLRGE